MELPDTELGRKATAKTQKSPWKRYWRSMAFLLLIFFGVIYSLLNPPPPETSEQFHARQEQELARAQALQAAQRQVAQDSAAQIARTKSLCKAKANCSGYAAARQACATAGNFDTCMSIKTENYSSARYDCTNDGKLISSPADLPNDFDCLLSKVQ
jgi:hypothetical protein